MSLKTTFSRPFGGAQFEKPKPEVNPPEIGVSTPLLLAFAFYKQGGEYIAEAIRIQGDKVVDRKVIAKDDYRYVALDAADKATFANWNHGDDPFAKRREE